jgi:hypothetical protein
LRLLFLMMYQIASARIGKCIQKIPPPPHPPTPTHPPTHPPTPTHPHTHTHHHHHHHHHHQKKARRFYSNSTGTLRSLDLVDGKDPCTTLWIAAMVNSRCFSDRVGGEAVSLMVPCCDMANHSRAPNAAYRYDPRAERFALTALRDISAGEEVCISYGCIGKNNDDLMRDYGFVLPGNENDRLPFPTGDDILTRLKGGGVAPKLNRQRLLAAFSMGGAATRRKATFDEGDQGRRVAAFASLEPLQGVYGEVGTLQEELECCTALLDQCTRWLQEMPTTAATDEALLAGAEGPLSPRIAQAVAYRLEHKRLIQAAKTGLQRYWFSVGG